VENLAGWLTTVVARVCLNMPYADRCRSRQHRGAPYKTPTIMLELVEGGLTPYEAVTGLIRDAMYGSRTSGPDLRVSVPASAFGRAWGSRFRIMCLCEQQNQKRLRLPA
jgi:hypothetical protein